MQDSKICIFEASERPPRQDVSIVGADAGRQLARNRPRGALIAKVTQALNSGHGSAETLAARSRIRCARQRWRADRKAFLDRQDDPRRPVMTTSSRS